MCLLRDPGLDGSSITLEMLFKAGERKTSTGMTRLLQDKGGKDGRVDIQSQNLGWKKELEEMVLVGFTIPAKVEHRDGDTRAPSSSHQFLWSKHLRKP